MSEEQMQYQSLAQSYPTPYSHILKLERNYQQAKIQEFPNSNSFVSSFYFDIRLITKMNETGATEAYFAFGYRDSDGSGQKKITLIMLGLNTQNEVIMDSIQTLDQKTPVIWDAKIESSDPNLGANINKEQALQAITDYRKLDPTATFRTIHELSSGTFSSPKILKGLRIEMSLLLQFLSPIRLNTVHHFECTLGYHTSTIGKNTQKGHTLGIIGVESNKDRLITTGSNPSHQDEPDTDRAFDYCDPCPRVCPNFINF